MTFLQKATPSIVGFKTQTRSQKKKRTHIYGILEARCEL